jgi:hypothetical protein
MQTSFIFAQIIFQLCGQTNRNDELIIILHNTGTQNDEAWKKILDPRAAPMTTTTKGRQ